jgi:hypothetical protein
MTPTLARERAAQLQLLRARAGMPWKSSASFETVLALGGVRLPGASADGLLSPQWKPSPRMVVDASSEWVDFDAAERRDPCQIRPAGRHAPPAG